MNTKPLQRKSYGSIGHLPDSRRGPGDHGVHQGQARICTTQARDKYDRIIVQEKLDGSCVAVARIGETIYSLGRAGWSADSSKFEQHRLFARWVRENEQLFRDLLHDGERVVGEWLAQAHGTRYDLWHEPFVAFDLMVEARRTPFNEFMARVGPHLQTPFLISDDEPLAVDKAMEIVQNRNFHGALDAVEGIVYRVERRGVVDFLAKFVRADKVDGAYLPEVSGNEPVWNWPRHRGEQP